MENLMTPAPTPTPLDLTRYLQQLAAHVGYQVDWSELDPACANHPQLVTAWVSAAAGHAGLAHARSLLPGPAAFLRGQVGTGGFDEGTGCEVAMLFGLHEHDQHLQTLLAGAAADFAGCCRRLAEAGTGLTWRKDRPVDPPTGPPAGPPAGLPTGPAQDTPVDPAGDAAGGDAHLSQPMPGHT
jgi:hypothetical protein